MKAMDDLSYPVPAATPDTPASSELLIKRSRFLTQIVRASSARDARRFIDAVRASHADATHNCWAYVAGPPGSTAQIGASDDGEPHGTAGRPMLQVLLHCGVGDICAVVTRWFGGIKLGTGGLVRAYQDSVAGCLETLPQTMKVAEAALDVLAGYADLDKVLRLAAQTGARTENAVYADDVSLRIVLPKSSVDSFTGMLADATDGRVITMPAELPSAESDAEEPA